MSDLQERVALIIRDKGLTRLPEPIVLRSGALSQDFVDAKRALAGGADLALACDAILEVAARLGIDFDAAGGMTLGADQFAHGVAIRASKKWFVVRKAAKGRGTNQRIEGATLGAGVRVLLLDDVVTLGGSIAEALDVVEGVGARVVGAVSLVDRSGAAVAFFAERGIPFGSVIDYGHLGIEPVQPLAGPGPSVSPG